MRRLLPLALVGVGLPFACSSGGGSSVTTDGGADDAGVDARPRRDAGSSITGPDRLSDTGLYADFGTRTLAPGVMAFSPRYPFWSDGAEKNRYLLLPPGTKIDTSEIDQWAFPIGTKVWKEFEVGGKLVETRMLWKKADLGADGWWMSAYVWRADGSDADATVEGVPNVAGTTHDVPSQEDCMKCHMDVKDAVIGFSALQLSNGGSGLLSKLVADGLLTNPPAGEYEVPGTGVVKDTLAYLHANCAHCHNGRQRILANQTPIRLNLRLSDTVAEQTLLYTTTIGTKMKHEMPGGIDTAVVKGQPDKSELWVRMTMRDFWAMPPLATKQVDPAADVVRQWILSLQ
jgi:hypothetical protein